jgi:hypothetical protein
MATKDDLVQNVKAWMKVDGEMKVLQKEMKERRKQKKTLTDSLVEIMKTNEIDCLDMKDGNIVYTKNKVKAPLSKKYLMESLGKYFETYPDVEAIDVSNFIMENRAVTIKEGVKLKK